MSDEAFYAPDRKASPPTPRLDQGEELWNLTRDGRTMTCQLRDDSRRGAGWDVVVLQGGELSFSKRCPDEALARFTAHAMRQDQLRAGWAEAATTEGMA